MAGHIAGLGYSVRNDLNGHPLVAWTLTVYTGGTSTPSSVFQDYALSIAHTNPIVADANGMLPMFWVADGTYRVRGLDAQGNELFDDDGIVALGPSSGTGGGGSSVDSNAIAQTGWFDWQPISGTRTGWVRANARTIGSAASGGTERANADAESLFLHLWNNYSDSLCPVTGGRGANAAADWAANKVIATLDMRTKLPLGLDDMGNTALGVTSGSTSAAASVGASTVSVLKANLPSTTFTISATALTSVSISDTRVYTHRNPNQGQNAQSGAGAAAADDANTNLSMASPDSGTITATAATTVTGTAASGGSGTHLAIMNPARAGTWYCKL